MRTTVCFPSEFDYEFYKSIWPKAAGMSPQDAHDHFRTFGKQCGLPGSPLADMRLFAQFLNTLHFGQILEIGPWATPRMVGENVCYFDVTSREDLRQSAQRMGIDPANVPEIHYQSDDGSLQCIDRKFDLVFSSHCIEHVYDIIRHMNEVADLLEDGGVYALIVPDKRYTFDHFRPTTSLGDIVDQHFRELDRHTLKTFVDTIYAAHNDPRRHWDNDHGEIVRLDAAMRERAMALYRSTGGKGSKHAWVFTDATFREVFTQLAGMECIRLRPIRIYNTVRNSNSFCVIMQKTSKQQWIFPRRPAKAAATCGHRAVAWWTEDKDGVATISWTDDPLRRRRSRYRSVPHISRNVATGAVGGWRRENKPRREAQKLRGAACFHGGSIRSGTSLLRSLYEIFSWVAVVIGLAWFVLNFIKRAKGERCPSMMVLPIKMAAKQMGSIRFVC